MGNFAMIVWLCFFLASGISGIADLSSASGRWCNWHQKYYMDGMYYEWFCTIYSCEDGETGSTEDCKISSTVYQGVQYDVCDCAVFYSWPGRCQVLRRSSSEWICVKHVACDSKPGCWPIAVSSDEALVPCECIFPSGP